MRPVQMKRNPRLGFDLNPLDVPIGTGVAAAELGGNHTAVGRGHVLRVQGRSVAEAKIRAQVHPVVRRAYLFNPFRQVRHRRQRHRIDPGQRGEQEA